MASSFPIASMPVEQSGFPSLPRFIAFIFMAFGMFMAILDIQIVSASLREIQAGLSASADEIVWVQSSYLVAEIIMIPLSGFLSRALSTRWLFVLSSAGFTIASALCATAGSINEMIVYRALQGFLGGAMIPTVFATSFAIFGRKRQVGATVAVTMIVTLAPTVGPVLGGWITEYFSWHWLFLVNVVPGILVTTAVAAFLDIDQPDFKLLMRIDVPGLILMAVFLGGMEYVLEEGARKQWLEDEVLRTWMVVTFFAGIAFFIRLATAQEPIVRLKPFLNYNFSAGSFVGAIVGIGLYGLTYLYPLYLTQVARLSSGQVGNVLFVSGLCMVMTAPVAGILSRKFDVRIMAMVGMLIMALSTWMSKDLTAEWRFDQFLLPQILRGVGLMLCMVSVSTTAFGTLPAALLKDGSGLFTLLRNLGGAVGLALINTVIQWRSSFHWARQIEHVTLSRPEVQAQMERLSDDNRVGEITAATAQQVKLLVAREVSVMTFADCFTLMAIMFVVVAFIPPLLRKPLPATGPGEGH